MSLQDFKKLFVFDSGKIGNVGVERECFLANKKGALVPQAPEILKLLETRGMPHRHSFGYEMWMGALSSVTYEPVRKDEFGYELSACQLETRIGPCTIENLSQTLKECDARLNQVVQWYELRPLHCEVGPEDMPLDVYPDPTGRYQHITKDMPRDVLLAACRVIGTHVHVGMRDHAMALRVYNYVIRHLAELCELGNGSFGERLSIYRQMAPDYEPKAYTDWNDYYQTALEKGFSEDPRKCWTLIRISVHGTIEFRMFGATNSVDRVVAWAKRCHELCQEAMAPA